MPRRPFNPPPYPPEVDADTQTFISSVSVAYFNIRTWLQSDGYPKSPLMLPCPKPVLFNALRLRSLSLPDGEHRAFERKRLLGLSEFQVGAPMYGKRRPRGTANWFGEPVVTRSRIPAAHHGPGFPTKDDVLRERLATSESFVELAWPFPYTDTPLFHETLQAVMRDRLTTPEPSNRRKPVPPPRPSAASLPPPKRKPVRTVRSMLESQTRAIAKLEQRVEELVAALNRGSPPPSGGILGT